LQVQKMHRTQPQLPAWDSQNDPTTPVYHFFDHALKDTVSRTLTLVFPFMTQPCALCVGQRIPS
jgi:hypothetical protein